MSLKEGIVPLSLNVLADSCVPAASGLSSSSALTVCAAMVGVHANGLEKTITKQDFCELTIKYERMLGTACGGMDQTASIMGERGQAMKIDFIPEIKINKVMIPEGLVLVIANSLTPSPKLLSVGTRYNLRVVECRFAAAIIGVKTGLLSKP
jgi:galactokinase